MCCDLNQQNLSYQLDSFLSRASTHLADSIIVMLLTQGLKIIYGMGNDRPTLISRNRVDVTGYPYTLFTLLFVAYFKTLFEFYFLS